MDVVEGGVEIRDGGSGNYVSYPETKHPHRNREERSLKEKKN